MKSNELVKISVAMIVVGGMIGLVGCGGKKEVKPEPTPVVAETPAPTPEPTPEMKRYSVKKGDSLWAISGQSDIYGDNFQWPLIFKANRDQIEDPDIIEVGQDLAISHEFKPEEVQQAIENAKRTPQYKPHTKPRKRLPIEY